LKEKQPGKEVNPDSHDTKLSSGREFSAFSATPAHIQRLPMIR